MPGNIDIGMTWRIAYISMGSNQGKRRENCIEAISEITRAPHARLLRQSCFYETEPVDMIHQPWFVNAVAKLETTLAPMELLQQLKAAEAKAGRDFNQVRFGPRPLDLDILFFDDLKLDSPDLTIPHPRMHKRRFVLKPLCDIEPKLVHPVLGKTVLELLEELPKDGQRIYSYP